uniref:Zinc-finger domain-containing protein n=1 Tax=Zea mays TaxID=4577 RepID=B8A2S4_MAIZE|nr:unknown [Zea mays]
MATAVSTPADLSPTPAPRRRGRPPKNPAPAEAPGSPADQAEVIGDYERERDARIRENMERMQKLGILDLAHTLSHCAAASGLGTGSGRWRRKPVEPGSAGGARVKPASPAPSRRPLRLKDVEPVTYREIEPKKEKRSEGGKTVLMEVGAKEEIYTEEHDKLLGTCNTPWTLFVDGYGKDGKRIYDQVRGQTCHQCRQKTLGHHTSCCKCQIVQGQFCGDCLYMRYGENVLEVKKNPNWICPVCRGICNCSLCRTKKGWFPTGSAYRKAIGLGYKSVAHFLIATHRASSVNSSSVDNNKLPFAKSETSCISDHANESPEDGETTSKAKQNKATRRRVRKSSDGDNDSRSGSVVTSDCQDDQANKDAGCVTPSSKPASTKRKYVERSPDCIASRLRSRLNMP